MAMTTSDQLIERLHACDQPKVHAHAVLGRRDGSCVGGHVLEARVRLTLEVILVESPGDLRKTCGRETGLALIDIGAPAPAGTRP
jgi:predicted DNA-binding protein with PD1-like motif